MMLGIHHNCIQTVCLLQTKFRRNPIIAFRVDHHTLCNLLFQQIEIDIRGINKRVHFIQTTQPAIKSCDQYQLLNLLLF